MLLSYCVEFVLVSCCGVVGASWMGWLLMQSGMDVYACLVKVNIIFNVVSRVVVGKTGRYGCWAELMFVVVMFRW